MLASLNHPGIAVLYSFEEIPGLLPLPRHAIFSSWSSSRAKTSVSASPPALFHSKSLFRTRSRSPRRWRRHTRRGSSTATSNPRTSRSRPTAGEAPRLRPREDLRERIAEAGSAASATQSPTLTARATAAGVILGTAAYMSPSRRAASRSTRGRTSGRSGAFSTRCSTGKRAFEGETVCDTLAAVLMKEPDWAALPAGTPGKVKEILRKCLRRDAKLRLRDIGDARLDLEEIARGRRARPANYPSKKRPRRPSPTVGRSAGRTSRERGSKKSLFLSWAIAAAFAAAAGAFALRARAPQAAGLLARSALLPPEGATFSFGGNQPGPPASPRTGPASCRRRGGKTAARNSGFGRSARRPGSRCPARRKGSYPFWSPDGRSIAFFADGKLKRVEAAGGPPLTLCDAPLRKGRNLE